jgi:hypothetical protein
MSQISSTPESEYSTDVYMLQLWGSLGSSTLKPKAHFPGFVSSTEIAFAVCYAKQYNANIEVWFLWKKKYMSAEWPALESINTVTVLLMHSLKLLLVMRVTWPKGSCHVGNKIVLTRPLTNFCIIACVPDVVCSTLLVVLPKAFVLYWLLKYIWLFRCWVAPLWYRNEEKLRCCN